MNADLVNRAALAVALSWIGCAPPPQPPAEAGAPAESRPEDFSRDRAAGHLEALAAIGPRPAGSEGSRRARDYIASALRALDLEAREQRVRVESGSPEESLETVNLLAAIPGDSPDAILLVGPYDSPPGGAGLGDGASGAALVLELGRALKERRLPYTVWLAFVEGDALARGGEPGAAGSEPVGTGALVTSLGAENHLERVRVAVYFDRVADPVLRVARDLLSNRTWREEFWGAARRLGRTDAFPPDAPFESADGGHRAFLGVGMRRAVAIVGARSDGGSASGATADGPAHPSPDSLAVVGGVSLEALRAIAERLAKIDRFVESPLAPSAPGSRSPADPPAGVSP